ncbi:MAG: ATP-binding protein [Methylococcales bacterium]|nr:ATP-binding protein [Methylococcales bacterium]
MINRAELKNFGPIKELDWQNLGKINLVIGNNGCGKSFLLKALYSAVRTLEDYRRGDNPESATDILTKNLRWTFQPDEIGDLVKDQEIVVKEEYIEPNVEFLDKEVLLSFSMFFNQQNFSYEFANDFSRPNISKNQVTPRTDNSIFLPAKEVLSLHHIILTTVLRDRLFGFDNTYFDLAIALQTPPSDIPVYFGFAEAVDSKGFCQAPFYNQESLIRGHGSNDFNQVRNLLEGMIGGRIEFNEVRKRWYFRQGEQRFPMGVTAEGIKKIAILDTLLGNGYLNENSIIFIDEPESALHPKAIADLLDIIAVLANHGIQFFLASHSYFVIKKLFLIAQEQQISIPVLSYQNNEWVQSDLKDDLPDNPIIDESIRLYEEQLDLSGI